MTTLRVLVGVGCLLAIMGVAVFVLLGRAVVFCVRWAGKVGERRPRHTLFQKTIPLQRP
jgi:hypothetical protein